MRSAAGQPTGRPSRNATRGPHRDFGLDSLLRLIRERTCLTAWHRTVAGKCYWAAVQGRLLKDAEPLTLRGGESLASQLYIHEVFSVEHCDATTRRRATRWAELSASRDAHRCKS